jgi:hypothetical protein
MAIVRRLEKCQPSVEAKHSETEGTYAIVQDVNGTRYLQVDTYGSCERKMAGKKSQSIRFAPDAIAQLSEIIRLEFGS